MRASGVWRGPGAKLIVEGAGGKEASDARGGGGGGAGAICKPLHVMGGNAAAVLQGLDKLTEAAKLHRGRGLAIEITDEADANAVGLNQEVPSRRERGLLMVPALADLQFAVGEADAIADEE